MIDHKTIAKQIVEVCNKHNLTNDQATKCLIYTATKLIAQRFGCAEVEAADTLSKAALRFRDEIARVDRMMANKGLTYG